MGLTAKADKGSLTKRSSEEHRGSRLLGGSDGKHSLQKIKEQKQRNDRERSWSENEERSSCLNDSVQYYGRKD